MIKTLARTKGVIPTTIPNSGIMYDASFSCVPGSVASKSFGMLTTQCDDDRPGSHHSLISCPCAAARHSDLPSETGWHPDQSPEPDAQGEAADKEPRARKGVDKLSVREHKAEKNPLLVKTIPLTRGMVTLVDDQDFEFLNQWKWCAFNHVGYLYAGRCYRNNGTRRAVFMHRLLMGADRHRRVDHKDRNTLNNQRSNLRFATPCQNMGNRGISKNNSTGFKGVQLKILKSGIKKYKAMIGFKSKLRAIGEFLKPQDAARAYDRAAVAQWGEFALTNKQLGLI